MPFSKKRRVALDVRLAPWGRVIFGSMNRRMKTFFWRVTSESRIGRPLKTGRWFSRSKALFSLFLVGLGSGMQAQVCFHGGALTQNVFSTNCLGQLVLGRAHIGDTVGVLIAPTMVDDCPGD